MTLNKHNLFNVTAEDDKVSYSRQIDNTILTIHREGDILLLLQIFSQLTDDEFKYLFELSKSVVPDNLLEAVQDDTF